MVFQKNERRELEHTLINYYRSDVHVEIEHVCGPS